MTLFSIFSGYVFVETVLFDTKVPAPENLRTAPGMFQAKLAVERPDIPVDAMKQTAAWRELEAAAGQYADEMKTFLTQRQVRAYGGLALLVLATIGMTVSMARSRVDSNPTPPAPRPSASGV